MTNTFDESGKKKPNEFHEKRRGENEIGMEMCIIISSKTNYVSFMCAM